ncbi:MAG: aldo/keto reductase [Anaerolineaceae bacterium]|nr:aldo/keto reductase [Anaerolineaceae bacterium]
MEYRNLGKTGVKVSVIGLGTNRFGSEKMPQNTVNTIIDMAMDHGVNHLDTANVYQGGASETALGNALKGRWDKFFLATKFFFPTGDGPNDQGASRYHISNAVETSLKRLQHETIDLYYIHRWDENTPIAETMRALDDLIRMGKVRYLGASEFAAWQLAEANLLAEFNNWSSFSVLQSHYHMLERSVEKEILPYCNSHEVGFIPFFPLAGGFLTGKYKRGKKSPSGSRGEDSTYVQGYFTDEYYSIIEKLETWATKRDFKLNELAIAWLASQPGVISVITGVTNGDQLKMNIKAADWQLTSQEIDEINGLLEN